MARQAKRKLPKSIRQALDSQQQQERKVEAIDPMRSENPILTRPPDVQRAPVKALPAPSNHAYAESNAPSSLAQQKQLALPPPADRNDTEVLLQRIGTQVLIGRESEDVCTFWLDLNEDILEGMRICITMDRGRFSARMYVTSSHTESYIRERLPRLRQRFQRRGLHLDTIEILAP